MISTCNLIRSHRNSCVKNVKLLFGELAIIKNSKYVGLLEMLQQRSVQLRSTSVPDREEINLDRHYSNQTCYPQTHLFFMNFHPPYQTFAETTCGHECISWNVCMYSFLCLTHTYVCVCVASRKSIVTFHNHLQTNSPYLYKMLFICPAQPLSTQI